MTSWVDGVLAQIENHEATVSSAIGRVRQSVFSDKLLEWLGRRATRS